MKTEHKISIALYALAFLAALFSYGCSNHSRNFTINADEGSAVFIEGESTVKKQGDESSANTPDISPAFTIPVMP